MEPCLEQASGSGAAVPREPGLFKAALLWLVCLGAVFFIGYNWANHYTASRPDVGSFFYAFERRIPFWPWTIVPYWSIDFFFAVSLFLCRTRAELRIHGLRLLLAMLLCIAGFLLFPLRFAFTRPETSGLFGALFQQLELFDLPYNQAPSLHIALLCTLWSLLWRITPKRLMFILHGWTFLIALSVLTTWQHHVTDLYTGFILGVVVCYILPPPPLCFALWEGRHSPESRRLAQKYLLGALVLLFPSFWGGAWLLCLWPAAALGIVAAGYGWFGPSVFQKNAEGNLTPSARMIMAPYYLGAWLSYRYYTAKTPPWSKIAEGILLTQYPGPAAFASLFEGAVSGVPAPAAVLDTAAGWAKTPFARNLPYASLPRMDLVPPSEAELEESVQVLRRLAKHGPVLVHCALGLSRSAIVVAAWLAAEGIAKSAEEAVALVQAARPGAVLKEGHREVLQNWLERRGNCPEEEMNFCCRRP